MSDYEHSVRVPQKGEDVFLTREEDAFVKRILSRPETFPQDFWRAIIQKVALDGEPIPSSQIQGSRKGLWESYETSWVATSVNPSLGNGQLTSRFRRDTSSITISIFLSIGSTTTLGSGTWVFTVPAGFDIPIGLAQGVGRSYDSSTGFPYVMGVTAFDTASLTAFTDTAFLSPTSPFAWAAGDNLIITFSYEV